MKLLGQRSWTVSICGYTSHHDIGNLSHHSGLRESGLGTKNKLLCVIGRQSDCLGDQAVKKWDWFVRVCVCLQCDSYCRHLNNMNELHGSTYMQILSLCTCFSSTWEKAMAPHSSTLSWKIPWTEEPGRLQPMGSLRVGHDWVTSLWLFTFMPWGRKWQPTPLFLPGESQGRGSLVGCRLWGRTESDTTEVT